MECKRCNRSGVRIFADGYCGICQVTVYRRGPAAHGVETSWYHPERDPLSKQMELTMRWANRATGNPNYMDNKLVSRFEKTLLRPLQADEAVEKTPEIQREHAMANEFQQHAEAVEQAQMREYEQQSQEAFNRLRALDEQVKGLGGLKKVFGDE